MDVHRVGTFDTASGRFGVLLDLNDGTNYAYVRDTFKVTPYQETALYPKSTRRYGGSSQAGESHDNGTIQATWIIGAGVSADDTLAKWDALVALLESTRSDLFYEWRPDGASRSTYYKLQGGTPWDPLYSWVMFAGARVMQVTGGWQVAPVAYGAQMDIFDDFSVDTITAGDYTFDAGAGTLTVSGGVLVPSSTAAKILRHTGRGYSYTDVQATLKWTTGSSGSGAADHQIGLRYIDASNFLVARVAGGSTLQVGKWDAGSYTSLAATSVTVSANTDYWLTARIEAPQNNGRLQLIAEWWTAAPSPVGSPAASIAFVLTPTELNKFLAGPVALRLVPGSTTERYDDLEILPYTYVRRGAQTAAAHVFDLTGIPGTAPAQVDAVTTVPASTVAASALIGWTSKGAPLTGCRSPFGLIEAETRDTTGSGGANGTNAAYSGGAYSADGLPGFYIDPGSLDPDDFADTVSIEVWAIVGAAGAGSGGTWVRAHTAVDDGAVIYSAEYGSNPFAHTFPVANGRQITRCGTLTLPATPAKWELRVYREGSVANVDALLLVPARQRACTPTGQATTDATVFLSGAGTPPELTKTIRSDLSGTIAVAGDTSSYPSSGLSGQVLEFPPGSVSVLHRLGLSPVDAPDAAAVENLSTSTLTAHYRIWPRFHLARSG